jgi:hypothetical protein
LLINDLFCYLLGSICIQVEDVYGCSTGSESQRDGPPDAARSAGYDRTFAVESKNVVGQETLRMSSGAKTPRHLKQQRSSSA